MKNGFALMALFLLAGCNSQIDLKTGYYEMGSPEENEVVKILEKSEIIISLGYAGSSYTIGDERSYGIDMNDIKAKMSQIKRKDLAIIHEQINYSNEHNDQTKEEIISLLQANSFKTIVITSGTGNRGGTDILKVIK